MKKFYQGIALFAVLLLAGLLVFGCSPAEVDQDLNGEAAEAPDPEEQETEEETGYVTVTDMAGRTVEVPQEIDKVITLCGCAHRLLVYLDAAEMISGVRESEKRDPLRSPWNLAMIPEIYDIPVVSDEDAETIIAVNPDLMVAAQAADGFDFFEHEDLANKAGVPLVTVRLYVSFSEHRDKVMESLRVLGQALDREERAEELIAEIELIIADLDERTRDIPDAEKPSVYVGGKAWAGSMGITSTSSMYSAFDFINANNAAAEVGEENAFIDKEALLLWDPDYIFLEATGFEQALEDLKGPEFESLTALQNGNVYRILPKIWTNTNHETVLANAYYIGSVIYPEQFGDFDMAEKADQIFETFVGKPVYNEMVEVHGSYERVALN